MNIADEPNKGISLYERLDALSSDDVAALEGHLQNSKGITFFDALAALPDDVSLLVDYLRYEEPTTRDFVALTQMLDPKHKFHFQLQCRKVGHPEASLDLKSAVDRLMSKTAISASDLPELVAMLDPDLDAPHPFRLHVIARRGPKRRSIWLTDTRNILIVAKALRSCNKNFKTILDDLNDKYGISRTRFFAIKKRLDSAFGRTARGSRTTKKAQRK